MATIDLGKIKLVWRGTYAGGTAYTVDDVVQHTDSGLTSSFICTTNSTGNAPSTGGSVHSSWAYLAKGGVAGTDVGTTLTTQGDILYRAGSGLQRLAKGTAAQVLKMNSAANAPEWGTDAGGAIRKMYQYYRTSGGSTGIGTTPTGIITSSTITPVSTASVFYVTAVLTGGSGNDGTYSGLRFSTDNGSNYTLGNIADSNGSRMRGAGGSWIMNDNDNGQSSVVHGYFAPNINSANFKIQLYAGGHSGATFYYNYYPSGSNDSNKCMYVSWMTVWEVDSGVSNNGAVST